MTIFQQLYDLEINFKVSCFWDGGFDVALGDDWNGWKAESQVQTWEEVGAWLRENAALHWPSVADKLREGPADPQQLLTNVLGK